jgi:O-antigen ligase
MFAIPGILGILFFVYLRPQEAYDSLSGLPFLYLFFALSMFGAAVDLRLRVTKAISIPALPWVAAFVLWCLLSVAIKQSDALIGSATNLFITVAIFALVAQSIQRFQILEKVAGMLVFLAIVLSVIGIHQSLAPKQCVVAPTGEGNHNETGSPDGRPCLRERTCYDDSPDPAAEYMCERAGLMGTHSIAGRVRYRGVLQDPNELAVALVTGLALLFALWLRSGSRFWGRVSFVSFLLVAWAVKETGSRSGQLGFIGMLTVFLFWRYRWKIAAVLGPLAVPALLLVAKGGSDRGDAGQSTEDRYEAWRVGFEIFRESPIWGVGFGQFSAYHHLTAHNTYVLVLAELGVVGAFIFSMLMWISIKTPLMAWRRYEGHPEARAAEVWSVALIGAMLSILSGCAFLSFAYHYVLWIFWGLAGALFICIKRHDPDFEVRISFLDVMGVLIVNTVLFVMLELLLRVKGF